MGAALAHRGPDGDGTRTIGDATLGCRRLAIIDVAGGAQPLANETGDVVAVCNGEIYNHVALRERLAARGHRFRTGSDAEVLPHLYEEHGPDLVHELEGMFGLAIWDARARRLVLTRDRMGEKPLYHAAVGGRLCFASEPKALLAAGAVAREPNWPALAAYLCQGYVPWPASAFTGIANLPPGGRLVHDAGGVRLHRYWEAASWCGAPALDLDPVAAAMQVRAELARSVEAALMSDVPLGVFLSGGLDSTAIATLARPHVGELATFSIGFDVPGFDELVYAGLVARALGARHRTLTVTPDLFLDGVRALAGMLDEPLADPALVPTFLLSRMAREDVKVVLVGEGGDELFAGYPTYLGDGAVARRVGGQHHAALSRAPVRGGSHRPTRDPPPGLDGLHVARATRHAGRARQPARHPAGADTDRGPDRGRRAPRSRPRGLPARRPLGEARPRGDGGVARGARAVHEPSPGGARLPAAALTQTARPRDQARAPPRDDGCGASGDQPADEARSHRAAGGVARRTTARVRRGCARPPRSPSGAGGRRPHAARRPRGPPPRQPARALVADHAPALARVVTDACGTPRRRSPGVAGRHRRPRRPPGRARPAAPGGS